MAPPLKPGPQPANFLAIRNTKHANNAGHRLDDCAVIQGHPDMWNDASFAAFKKIVDQLLADGWMFVTPHDFATTP